MRQTLLKNNEFNPRKLLLTKNQRMEMQLLNINKVDMSGHLDNSDLDEGEPQGNSYQLIKNQVKRDIEKNRLDEKFYTCTKTKQVDLSKFFRFVTHKESHPENVHRTRNFKVDA